MKRTLFCLFLFAAAGVRAADAPPVVYSFKEKLQPGMQVHHRVELAITGKMATDKGEQPLTGNAVLQYPERILELAADGMAKKVVRHYGGARAKFQVATTDEERSLRQAIRTMVGERTETKSTITPEPKPNDTTPPKPVERTDFGLTVWSPGGPLTGDECELVEDVIDTTRIPGILPKGDVKIGDKWKIDGSVVQGLCNIENLIAADMEASLTEVKDGKATFRVSGSSHGMSLGAEVKLRVEAIATFDIASSLVEQVVWAQSDNRAQSPVAPQGSYQVKITITRDRSDSPNLTDKALSEMDLVAKESSRQLLFEPPNRGYRFLYDRSWHITTVQPNLAVMRRVVGNEFVAQMSVAATQGKAGPGKMKQDEFQKLIEQTNGVKLEEIVSTDDVPVDGGSQGLSVQKIAAYGVATDGKLKLAHRHYLASNGGKQLMFSYMMEASNEKKLGDADTKMIGSLELGAMQVGSKDGASAPPK